MPITGGQPRGGRRVKRRRRRGTCSYCLPDERRYIAFPSSIPAREEHARSFGVISRRILHNLSGTFAASYLVVVPCLAIPIDIPVAAVHTRKKLIFYAPFRADWDNEWVAGAVVVNEAAFSKRLCARLYCPSRDKFTVNMVTRGQAPGIWLWRCVSIVRANSLTWVSWHRSLFGRSVLSCAIIAKDRKRSGKIKESYFYVEWQRKHLVELIEYLVKCELQKIKNSGWNDGNFLLTRNLVNLNRIVVISIRILVCSYFTRYLVGSTEPFFRV